MNVTTEKFETDWFDVIVRLSPSEIDALVANLERMKGDASYHFHIQSKFESSTPDLSNLTFYSASGDEDANVEMYPISD